MMTKLLIGLLGAGVIATAGYAAATSVDTDPARTVSLPGATTNDDTTTATTTTAAATTDDVEDISGPCDEAEHRNDPRCAGAGTPAPAPAPGVTTADDDGPGDISGPCDEAEHRNDPRCTGGGTADDGGARRPRRRRPLRARLRRRRRPLRLEQRQGLVHTTTNHPRRNEMKLILLSLVATIVAAVSLAAVAQSATTAQTVRVTEVDYSIRLSAKPKPGVVKFVVRNAGDDGHDFWVKGGGKTWRTRVIGEAGAATLTATLKKGVKYAFWCGVGSHRSKGMSGSFVAR